MVTIASFVSQADLVLFLLSVAGLCIGGILNYPPAVKPDREGGGGHFTIREIVELSFNFLIDSFLDGKSITAAKVHAAVPEFSIYQRANGVGDAIGHGHASPKHPNGHPDSLKLHSIPGKSPRTFPAYRENAGRVWYAGTDQQRQDVVARFGIAESGIEDKIRALPSVNPTLVSTSVDDVEEELDVGT